MRADKKVPLLTLDSICCGPSSNTSSIPSPAASSCAIEPLFSKSTSYDWPNVYEETYEMGLVSILVYGILDVRQLARRGMIESSSTQHVLQLPIAAPTIVQFVSQNRECIREHIGKESTDAYLQAFDALEEKGALEVEFDAETGQAHVVSFDIVDVQDGEQQDQEHVYCICVHSARKRITVAFRGCSTRRDWGAAADNYLVEYSQHRDVEEDGLDYYDPDSPCSAKNLHHSSPPVVAMHRGFSQYLLAPRSSSKDDHKTNASSTSTYAIIANKVRALLLQHPTYHVYVTGHSLGGALATVFTYQASAVDRSLGSTMPITCITFASPMVGNTSFERSFKSLQRQGAIRHLRVTNDQDIFTQLPDRASYLYAMPCCWGPHALLYYLFLTVAFFVCCQNRVYRHVGMNLRLYHQPQKFKWKHPRNSSRNYYWRMVMDWKTYMQHTLQRVTTVPFVCFGQGCCCKVDFNKNHSILEHMRRLSLCAHELQQLYLNDLYEEKRLELV